MSEQALNHLLLLTDLIGDMNNHPGNNPTIMPVVTTRVPADLYLSGPAPFYPVVQDDFLKNHCKRVFLIFIKAGFVDRRDNILIFYCDGNKNKNNSQIILKLLLS